VLAVASYRQVPYIKALAIIFVSAAVVGGSTFYAFGLVAPKMPPEEEAETPVPEQPVTPPANIINATILAGSSAQNNPDYEPDTLTVDKGDGVQWTNADNVPHTVTSREPDLFDSGTVEAGATWLLNTVEIEAGEYEYYCIFHNWMVGTLNVVDGGAPPVDGAENATVTESPPNQSSSGNETSGAPSSGGATVTSVSMVVGSSVPTNGKFFDPEKVETTVGSMVTWNNEDSLPHTVTSGVVENDSPIPDGKFDSGIMDQGDSFPFVFDATGEYPYYCMIHPWMTGQVTVD
jgi:plastocyanin